jgi:periplasmic protein TonB
MNPFRNNVGTLNEILFENRNQNYGAYVIRKSYGNTVFKSLAITAGVFILGFWGLSLLVNTKVEVPTDTGANTPPEITTICTLTKPPKVIPVKTITSPLVTSKPETLNALGTKIIDSTEKAANTALNTNITPIGTNSLNASGTIPGPGTSTLTGEPTNTLTASDEGEFTMMPDVAPSMPNWSKILQENLSYPYEARQSGIAGKVVVNFIVDEEGKIIQTKILHHVAGGCDEEALRVIKLMPRWKPGMIHGKPVKVSFNQVITFKLN